VVLADYGNFLVSGFACFVGTSLGLVLVCCEHLLAFAGFWGFDNVWGWYNTVLEWFWVF